MLMGPDHSLRTWEILLFVVGSDPSFLQTSLGPRDAAGAGLDTLSEGTGAIFVEEVVAVFGNHRTYAPALSWQ